MDPVNTNLNTLFERLEKFFRTETVVGEPLKVGEVTLVPIIDVSFGLGTGGGAGKDSKGADGTGSGAGVGAKITPNCVLIIKDGEVSVIPIKDKGSVEKVLEMVPDLVGKISKKIKDKDKEKAGE